MAENNELLGKSKEASPTDFKDVVMEELRYKITKVKKAKK